MNGWSPIEEEPEFRRLLRYLTLSSRFMLALVHAETPHTAAALLEALPSSLAERRGEPVRLVVLNPYQPETTAPLPEQDALERVLLRLADLPPEDRTRGVLLVLDGSRYLEEDAPAWGALFGLMNEQRNSLVQGLNCEWLLLGPTLWLDLFARRAPDFWSIRSNEFCEDLPQQHLPPLPLERFLEALRACSCPPDAPLSEVYRTFATIEDPEPEEFVLNTLLRAPWKRLAEAIHEVHRGDLEVAATSLRAVRSELETIPKDPGFSPGELHLFACHLARVHASYVAFHLESPRAALKILQENKEASLYAEASASLFQFCNLQSQQVRSLYLSEMGIYSSFDLGKQLAAMEEESAEPQIWEQIAQLFQTRGSIDKVLPVYQDKIVPVYQRLGNVREEAITWGNIGDIHKSRGELDEALKIYEENVLPIFQRLGDMGLEATTWGKIGDILEERGKLDEALKIREEKELPVYKLLGDMGLEAITWGKIGDIYQVQGKLDEALKIREEKELPVFERLGAVRSEAITWGKIGDVLEERGKLDEALKIREEMQLPVFRRLGDVREEAITWGKIGDILEARGKLDEALKIREEKELPVYQRLGDVRLESITWGRIGDILEERGKLDEALKIREEKELPVYQRLGARRELLVAQANLAQTYLQRAQGGDREQARTLLREALQSAEDMGLPEAEKIRETLRRAGL